MGLWVIHREHPGMFFEGEQRAREAASSCGIISLERMTNSWSTPI